MLPRRRRLRAAEVRAVLARGRNAPGPRGSVSMKYLFSPEQLRSAVVVTKALARSAVVRNRLRRAAYRALGQLRSPVSGQVVVFIRTIPEGPLTPHFLAELERLAVSLQ